MAMVYSVLESLVYISKYTKKLVCCIICWCCNNKIAIFRINQLIVNLCDLCFLFLENLLILELKLFLFYLFSIYIFLFKLFLSFCFFVFYLCFSCFVGGNPMVLIGCYYSCISCKLFVCSFFM